MQVHLNLNAAPNEIDMRLLVANGVTVHGKMVSDCPEWSWLQRLTGVDCPERTRMWQRRILAGEVVGPGCHGVPFCAEGVSAGRVSIAEPRPEDDLLTGRDKRRMRAASGKVTAPDLNGADAATGVWVRSSRVRAVLRDSLRSPWNGDSVSSSSMSWPPAFSRFWSRLQVTFPMSTG
jgi:hypothetical protein